MRPAFIAGLLLVAAMGFSHPAAAAPPPVPPDLAPREWKPQGELKKLLEDFEVVRDQDQLADHIKKVEALLAAHPDWIDLNRHYIGVTRLADRWAEVQAAYREKASRDSLNAINYYYLGLFERGSAAESYFRKSLSVDPQNFYALCGLGLSLVQGTAQPDSAFQLLFEAVRMHPEHPYGFQALALAYEISKDYENGIKVRKLEEVVEPQSFQPVNYEARDLQQVGRPEEGTALIEAFVKKHPKDRNALKVLMTSYKSANRDADARRTQVQLATISENDPNEAYAAAEMLASGGDPKHAREWLKKAIDRGYDDHVRAASDPALASIRADSTYFTSVVNAIKAEHEKRKPERRAKVLTGLIDKPAPGFELKTMDGRDLKLSDLKGKVVILDFWATWCGPCQLTLPLVKNVYESTQGKPVQILCMNVWEKDAERAKVQPYWTEKAYPMTVALASADDANSYGVRGIPTLFVIDPDGRIRYQHVGYAQYMDEDILWVVESLLADQPPAEQHP